MSTSNKRIPGPRSRALARRLQRVESRNVTFVSPEFPIFWQSGRGVSIQDVDGNTYLDLSSAFGVSSLGYSAPEVHRALLHQAKKLWHGMGDVHPNAVKVELLEELARVAPGDLSVSILSSSGSEAVESALKTARLQTGKPGVIVFDGAYHGLTYGTLPLTDRPEFQTPFQDQLSSRAVRLPFPDEKRGLTSDKALAQLDAFFATDAAADIGAILIEPVQGRGGIRVADARFLQGLRQRADRSGVLLIFDEVMCGFGRTGMMFACQHSGVVPDLMCVGKALANGFPISACIGTAEVMAAWPPSDGEAWHTSTFLGNPLGCAMALAALRTLHQKKLSARAHQLGKLWKAELIEVLAGHPRVWDIRGVGLMMGIELVSKKSEPDAILAARVVTEGLKRGLILLSGGKERNVLTLTPPLIISAAELKRSTRLLRKILDGETRTTH